MLAVHRLRVSESRLGQIDSSEQMFAGSEKHRRDSKMHFIYMACLQELANS